MKIGAEPVGEDSTEQTNRDRTDDPVAHLPATSGDGQLTARRFLFSLASPAAPQSTRNTAVRGRSRHEFAARFLGTRDRRRLIGSTDGSTDQHRALGPIDSVLYLDPAPKSELSESRGAKRVALARRSRVGYRLDYTVRSADRSETLRAHCHFLRGSVTRRETSNRIIVLHTVPRIPIPEVRSRPPTPSQDRPRPRCVRHWKRRNRGIGSFSIASADRRYPGQPRSNPDARSHYRNRSNTGFSTELAQRKHVYDSKRIGAERAGSD